MRSFVGVVDRGGVGAGEAARLAAALDDGADTIATPSLALAWTGNDPPAGEPLCFVDGSIYAGAPPGPDLATALSAALARQGGAAMRPLRGDFALVLWDERNRAGLLARDHMGGRGLYWHDDGTRTTFASEVRPLLRVLRRRPPPDETALAHWLGVSGQPNDATLFAGVHRLPAGSLIELGGSAPRPRRWWSPRYEDPAPRGRAEHVAELRDRLAEAVGRRCRPGETTGVLLSGGLDSSTVAALAAQLGADRRPERAYSATFPDHPTIDESELVGLLCRELGLESTLVVVRSGSVIAGAADYIRHWDLPPPSPNVFFWLPLLRRAAAHGIDALLDGEGGDELFGLAPYLLADRLRAGRVAGAFALSRAVPGGGAHLRARQLWPMVREFGVKGATPRWLHRLIRRRRGSAYLPPYLSPALRQAYVDSDVHADWKGLDGPRWWAFHVWASVYDLGLGLAYDHVRRRAAMAGLEARHPLVDVDVVECVLRIPPELAFDTRYSRPLVREAMDGLLPNAVRLRPTKSVFDALFHDALAGPDLACAREVLAPGSAEVGAYVDLEVVQERLLRAPPPAGERLQWAMELWRLVTAEAWLRAADGTGLPPERWPLGARPDLDVR